MIRKARLTDVPALVRIENRSFKTDRFSRRSFRYLLSQANAVTLVEVAGDGTLRGYVMVLFSRGTSLARLYSIAVDPDWRGKGIGASLLQSAEEAAVEHQAASMRLEVRADDRATQAFYRRHGYKKFAVQPQYYEDQVDAVRMEKSLAPGLAPHLTRVPFYYAQTLDFTCGPAALLMAMHALDSAVPMNQGAEIALWRESTTIFMTSGHGGCSPHGLALAAHERGFGVELYLNQRGVLFVDSVRSESKKAVIRLVEQGFQEQLKQTPIRVVYHPLSLRAMREKFDAGGIPVVLISSYAIDRSKQPHWVVVAGFDARYVYVHDPYVDHDEEKSATDCMQIPIPQRAFARMARYGRSQQKAALVLSRVRDAA